MTFLMMVGQGCIKFTYKVTPPGGKNIRVRAILGKNIQGLVRNCCFLSSKRTTWRTFGVVNTAFVSPTSDFRRPFSRKKRTIRVPIQF